MFPKEKVNQFFGGGEHFKQIELDELDELASWFVG